MPELLFSGFSLDRQHGRAGGITGPDPRRALQAAASDDGLRNAAYIL
jgi:hypothetical protein